MVPAAGARWAWIAALPLCSLLWAGASAALDRGADGKFDQRRSIHFKLLQDVDLDHATGRNGTRVFEREVLSELERAYERVRKTFDIRPRSDIKVVIYDPTVFDATFADHFRFSAVGFYDGSTRVIHVRGGKRVDQFLVRTLHHEYFHAALDAVTSTQRVPAWLNEGMSQWFENLALGKRGLSPEEYAVLSTANRDQSWLPLERLSGPTFADFDSKEARLAYLQAYGMVDYLFRTHGARRVRSFMRRFVRGERLSALIKSEFRVEPSRLESTVRASFR